MSNSNTSNGVGFCGMLTIVFIALKLMGYITWSWIWVLSPLWLGFVIIFFVTLIVLVVAQVITQLKNRNY